MALRFIEGFDHYSQHTPGSPGVTQTGESFFKKWTGTFGTTTWATPAMWNALSIDAYNARQSPGQGLSVGHTVIKPYKSLPGAVTDTLVFGVAMLFNLVSGAPASVFMGFLDNVSEQVSLRMDASGHLLFSRNGTTLATSTNVFSPGVWYYIEMKVKVHNTTGTYEVRVNGTATGWIPAATGANTRATTLNQITGIFLGSPITNNFTLIDDLYVLDTTGSANNDFLGPQMVATLRPSAPGTSTMFIPNFGKNFSNVNDIVPDNDGTFNASVTASDVDTFAFVDAPLAAGVIAGIQRVIYAKQDSGAQRVLAPVQRDGGGNHVGASVNLSTSYLYFFDCLDVDPNTGAAYTIANLNAAEFGYKLIS